ncbi:hypothetical protein Harman_39650 [Haloarcula mannanilytica]|uniref:Uncharacterized protein n=1 Tax=Haloarcula mannanilytica TaxID=2509225 RepID=A0A4C2ER96_9EURY|nr:hypothetical protein [Haloarcula mannanilytica]GCF16030.1 hypothetical protein Harman_39650 [Haloarcula mannanilytica]
MALSATTWVVMLAIVGLLWGSATVTIWKSMHDEERKLQLIRKQGTIDTYSPRAMADLREWIETHPADPYVDEARDRYNDCVETLREIDEPFYDWNDDEIASLEKL